MNMKKIIAITLLFVSANCFSQTENNFMQKNTFYDSVYFKVVPYNSGAGMVHLALDTVAGSPTFGKLVRKTASGSTPTLQQVMTSGNTTTVSYSSTSTVLTTSTGGIRVRADDNTERAAIRKTSGSGSGYLELVNSSSPDYSAQLYTASLSDNRVFYLPNTGRAADTLVTLADIRTKTHSKGLTLESPGSAEDFGMWKTQVAITVSSINAVVKGSSPSVTINIAFGSDITSLTNVFSSGTAITNTTTGQTVNSGFNDATIPAGSWIRLISTASSGTITQIEVTINYTED